MPGHKDTRTRKELQQIIWDEILNDVKNPELAQMLNYLFSAREKEIICNRIAAIALIKQGKTYSQISEKLWLSPTTIRSIKKLLNKNVNEYISYYKLKKVPHTHSVYSSSDKIDEIFYWVDHFIDTFPRKHGPRWKWFTKAQ